MFTIDNYFLLVFSYLGSPFYVGAESGARILLVFVPDDLTATDRKQSLKWQIFFCLLCHYVPSRSDNNGWFTLLMVEGVCIVSWHRPIWGEMSRNLAFFFIHCASQTGKWDEKTNLEDWLVEINRNRFPAQPWLLVCSQATLLLQLKHVHCDSSKDSEQIL